MPALQPTKYIWANGEFIFWGDANVHCLVHGLHYGDCVFEGIRCYKRQDDRLAIFRSADHITRLFNSAKIYHMTDLPFTQERMLQAIVETVQKNGLKDAYIRPFIFRGYGELGVSPLNCPIEIRIAAFPFVKYLGPEALEEGVDIMVSSHRRSGFPAMAKAGGQYLSSILIKVEAILLGFTEGVALDENGDVSECSGENIFVVLDGKLYTPGLSNSILPGITRHTIMTIAREILGLEVIVGPFPREMLVIADEVFMTGTWAEITPIRSISKQQIGDGKPGPITSRIQKEYAKITIGENQSYRRWLHFID